MGLWLKAKDAWPRAARVYCHPAEPHSVDDVQVVERVAVRSCVRRGPAIDLVLARAINKRSQFVFTSFRGRRMILWQTPKAAASARPGGAQERARTPLLAGRRRTVIRSRALAAALLPLALVLTAAEPELSPPADRVYTLVGAWRCATSDGSRTSSAVGVRNGDAVEVTKLVQPANGASYVISDFYAYDPSKGLWSLDIERASPNALHAIAAPWPSATRTWSALGRGSNGFVEHVRFELVGDTLARTVLREDPPASGKWTAGATETCTRGVATPAPTPCLEPNVHAHTIIAIAPETPRGAPRGIVQVVVGLDEHSRVVYTAIASSPAAALNTPALTAARRATFQTEIRDCRPIAAKYIFTVDFNT